jgi:hypothetical protein
MKTQPHFPPRRASGSTTGARIRRSERGGGDMATSHVRLGRIVGRVFVAAVALGVGSVAFLSAVAVTSSEPAGASVGCGVSFGTPQVEGAAGSFAFVVPTIPAVAGQVCNARISVVGTIATAGGTPSNVNGNGLSYPLTVSFLPSRAPPSILWQWSPHCADPVSNRIGSLHRASWRAPFPVRCSRERPAAPSGT